MPPFPTLLLLRIISKFHYNEKGLADKWDVLNYGLFTQEYNASGKVIKSTLIIDREAMNILYFFY